MQLNVTTPDGTPAGELTITADGVRTGFAYKCDTLFPPSRLVLQGSGGVLSVGIPAPQDGGLALSRKMTPLQLTGCDLSAACHALLIPADAPLPLPLGSSEAPPAPEAPETEPSPPEPEPEPEPAPEPEPECTPEPEPPCGWSPEPDPTRYFSDPELIDAARKISGALSRPDGADTLLAFPFSPSMPFPMLPAFRFGHAEEIDGGSYLVFRVREGGIV